MCGVFGLLSNDKIKDQVRIKADEARDILTHRGPDKAGSYVYNKIYIGHRRLSILDTSDAGTQPMVSEDQSVIITVNGEIYNFQKLREDLQSQGYLFRSGSDSEVILHGYSAWGIDALAKLIDGMYSIVIYDKKINKLFFIRDRVGIKPLYYYSSNNEFIWASELKAIKYYKDNHLPINNEALLDFLVYRYIPAPKTAYLHVFKLEPASILELDCNNFSISVRKYWYLSTEDKVTTKKVNDAHTKCLELLEKSTKEQLISDVPLGLFLSGGIDSSAVCVMASKNKSNIKTFSIGFSDPNHDETSYAQIVSKLCQTDHSSHYLQDEKMDNVLETMLEWFDEPYGDTSCIPTDYLCKVTKEKVTVALSGDGGDELFGGYKWYNIYNQYRKWQRFVPFKKQYGYKLPHFLPRRKGLEILTISDPIYLYAIIRGSLNQESIMVWKDKLGIDKNYDPYWAYKKYYNPKLSRRKAAQVMDFHLYLPDDILTKVDICSMRHALECRPVFLSKDLIEFSFGLSEDVIYEDQNLKGFLKKSLTTYLTKDILYRKKQGFSIPNNSQWKEKAFAKQGSLTLAMLEKFLKRHG